MSIFQCQFMTPECSDDENVELKQAGTTVAYDLLVAFHLHSTTWKIISNTRQY